MKYIGVAVLAVVMGTFGCSGSQAGTDEPVGSGSEELGESEAAHPGPGHRGPGMGMFREADTNNDGKVTLDEVRAASAKKFAAADVNHDGWLDQSELATLRPKGMKGPHAGAGRPGLDRDGNGTISREEAPPRLKERFDLIDTNRDGVLDQAEMKAAHGNKANGPKIDTDGDGKVTAAEFAQMAERAFSLMDKDGDGSIVLAEIGHGKRRHAK